MAQRRAIKTAVIIGAGNVATHLAGALSDIVEIKQIYSRNIENAAVLSSRIKAEAIDDLRELNKNADLYLIATSDSAIPEIIDKTDWLDTGIWAHTSGSTSVDVFSGRKERYGVFYPLQTFSKNKPVDMNVVPMLIEANNSETAKQLMELAEGFSKDVKYVDSEGRFKLHVAAVFACNFVNYMWTLADEELHKAGLTINSMMPLLRETLEKLNNLSPYQAQTGPARRGDELIMARHLESLSGEARRVYELLSNQILKLYNHE